MDRHNLDVTTPVLTLRQIESPSPNQAPRTLELWQSAAPVDQIKWGVSQRHAVKHYPGAAEAAVFLDGPEEAAVDLQFNWKSRRLDVFDALLDGEPVGNADDLVQLVEDLVRDRALVELSWRGRVLTGFLQEFVPVEGWESEYTATLTFRPTQSPRLERAPRPLSESPPESLYAGMFADWEASTEDLAPPPAGPRQVLSAVETTLDGVSSTFRRFGAVVSTEVEEFGQTTVQVYRGVGEVLSSLVDQAADLRDAVMIPAGALAQTDDPLAQMRARIFQRQLDTAALKTRRRGATERLYYRAVERRELLGVHVVAAGETIWSIAWRWYGTTEAWRLLANRNALTATSPPVGTRLLIPRREAA